MKVSKYFSIAKEALFLLSVIFFAIISIILGLVNIKNEDFKTVERSLINNRDNIGIVSTVELVLNGSIMIFLVVIAIKHNLSKSNGGIDVTSSVWSNDWNG